MQNVGKEILCSKIQDLIFLSAIYSMSFTFNILDMLIKIINLTTWLGLGHH